MSATFGYSREAVRVKVKKCEGSLQPEFRKFSVDPQITSFEVLQSILAKAFDLKGEFAISYKAQDVNCCETYMPLLTDWELESAFIKAHNSSMVTATEPCLCLRVDLKSFEECPDEWEVKTPIITQIRLQENKTAPRLHGIFNQVGKTLNMVQRAFNFGEDGNISIQPTRPPLSDAEFRKFLDPLGQIVHIKELRSFIYFGGIDPSLRKVVWKHILNVYPDGMTGKERMDYIRKKALEYVQLKETWKAAIAAGPVVGELAYTTGMVKKDVLRTDRHHPFYAGSDDNQNIASLFNILTTYALNHPKVSYCQGMSDLASPLLVTMGDEAHAYICFCALMSRLSTNFMIDGIAMTQKFTHLAEGLLYYDSEFYNYLKIHQADDLLFCYRWLLLEMKREFAFDDSLRMLEVLWSSLPPDPPEKELKLFDSKFHLPSVTPPISPMVKTPRENAYTKVCALRRQSSSISLASYSSKKSTAVKRQNHSLDETIGRIKNIYDTKPKHQSLDDASLLKRSPPKSLKNIDSCDNNSLSGKLELRPRSVSPLEQKSDSIILNNNKLNSQIMLEKTRSNSLSSSMTNLIKTTKRNGHFKELKEKITNNKINIFSSLDGLDTVKDDKGDNKPKGKMVKNFNEFLNFAAVNKNKISDKLTKINTYSELDKPKIMLTKSSFEESESSSYEKTSTNFEKPSSTSNDDTFDECSPDDSQEYFPMTTSVTRELRIELENLDRQVFGNGYNERLLESESPSSDCNETKSIEINIKKSSDQIDSNPNILKDNTKKSRDDIFIWQNPLHESSPNTVKQINPSIHTPDEQSELEFDSELGQMVDEVSSNKTITPIKILNHSININKKIHNEKNKKIETEMKSSENTNLNEDLSDFLKTDLPNLTSSCEEVTEVPRSTFLPPPTEFGGGNPFLMFLCITVLLQHRDHIIGKAMDYNEMAMHFDKMVRKHNVVKVLNQARQMYAKYMMAQQKVTIRNEDC
nr:uncharacterized protein LOC111427750 [Onthophagus taurus]